MLKKTMLILAVALLTVSIAKAVTVTVDDIIKLHQEGVSAEVIKTFITSSGQKFQLSADDILRLKKAGVPEDVIQLIMKTGAPPPEMVAPPARANGEIEPTFPYRARYHSVFSFQVFKKKTVASEKVLDVGKRDPLKNTAARGGTLFLTDNQIIIFDMDGDERFRLDYADITEVKIETRFKDPNEARLHPLDHHVLWIYFKKDGMEFFVKIFTLPRPDKVVATYGDVFDIGRAVLEYGKAANPKLAEPLKVD